MFCDSSFFLLSFHFPICCLFGRNHAVFENLNSFQYLAMLLCAHLLKPAVVHQFGSRSLPRITRAFPAPCQNFIQPFYFFLPHRGLQGVRFHHFEKFPTSILVQCMSLASSCTHCLFHISYTDTCWHQDTTPYDAWFLPFSYPRKPTFLLASA